MEKKALVALCIIIACARVEAGGEYVDELQQGNNRFHDRTPNAFHYYMDDVAKVDRDQSIMKRFQPSEAHVIYYAGDDVEDGVFQDVELTVYCSEDILNAIQILFGTEKNSWEVVPLSTNASEPGHGAVSDLGQTVNPFTKYTIDFDQECIPANSRYLKIVFKGKSKWNPILGRVETYIDQAD